MSLLMRQAAVDAVVAKFNGATFAWGSNDCARLAAAMAKAMGHKVSLAKFGGYRTEAAARAALARAGYARLVDVLDEKLMPIAPAKALPGDIIGLKSDDGQDWPALCVYVGNGAVLGFQSGRCGFLRVKTWGRAWSVTPGAVRPGALRPEAKWPR